MVEPSDRLQRLTGTLLGTAIGDALGLPFEGMSPRRIARRVGEQAARLERYHLFGRRGFVSDDTEQAALVAQSLARHPREASRCVRAFRLSLLGWFWRLPFGVGLATVRACFKIALGLSHTGVRSAGNGAAMRAAVVGAAIEAPEERRQLGEALARVTHTDARAVEAALFVAELVAAGPQAARALVTEPSLAAALDRATELAGAGEGTAAAAQELGTTGFVVHTVPFALFCYLRFGGEPMTALRQAIAAGGDTDSIGAILGAWLGARHGEAGLPASLVRDLNDGPFGPTHLRGLARAIASGQRPPRYSVLRALLRNLLLYPVVLAHGFRRLLP